MVVDMRKGEQHHLPLLIRVSVVEWVNSYKFLGVHISEDLKWTRNTSQLAMSLKQRVYLL